MSNSSLLTDSGHNGRYIANVRANSDAAAREALENVVDLLVTNRCKSFDDCIVWARKLFEVSCMRSALRMPCSGYVHQL